MPASILELRAKLGRPLIMGHRGAMGHAPENTMASFQRAFDIGVEAVELDVHLTKDGHLMAIHDETVDRTTNGKGRIADMTLAEVQALDAGSWFSPEFAGERVPTLEEVLVWADGKLPVVIEVKPTAQVEAVVDACVKLIDALDAGARVAFISFDHFIVRGIKKRRLHWQTGALYVGRVVDPGGMAGAALVGGLLPHFAYLTPDLVATAHDEQLWVGTWCPNTEAELQHAIQAGADMIGTNYPDRLRALLGV